MTAGFMLCCSQSSSLEGAFFESVCHAAASSGTSPAEAVDARLDLNAFCASLEEVASLLFNVPKDSENSHAALCAAVYKLFHYHLVSMVDEAGARLQRRIERYMAQKRSDMRSMTTNRPQLSSLFAAFSSKVKSLICSYVLARV